MLTPGSKRMLTNSRDPRQDVSRMSNTKSETILGCIDQRCAAEEKQLTESAKTLHENHLFII
jgi:hypothetical protein